MVIKGLDGKEHKLKLKSKPRSNASKLHIRARELLNKLFPNKVIYEEITLKGSKSGNNKDLYCDFFIASEKILIEVHGEQHYKLTYFHNTKLEFIQAKANDTRKRNWCILNDIEYIELPYKESDHEWESRIRSKV